jgi:hypothetical protein
MEIVEVALGVGGDLDPGRLLEGGDGRGLEGRVGVVVDDRELPARLRAGLQRTVFRRGGTCSGVVGADTTAEGEAAGGQRSEPEGRAAGECFGHEDSFMEVQISCGSPVVRLACTASIAAVIR